MEIDSSPEDASDLKPKTLDFTTPLPSPLPDRQPESDLSDVEASEAPPPPPSKSAIDKRLRRMFTPRKDGKYLVPAELVEQYQDKRHRGAILDAFERNGYDVDWVETLGFPPIAR